MSAHVSHAAKKAFGQQQLAAQAHWKDTASCVRPARSITSSSASRRARQPKRAAEGDRRGRCRLREGIVAYVYDKLAPKFALGANQSELCARLWDAFAATHILLRLVFLFVHFCRTEKDGVLTDDMLAKPATSCTCSNLALIREVRALARSAASSTPRGQLGIRLQDLQ